MSKRRILLGAVVAATMGVTQPAMAQAPPTTLTIGSPAVLSGKILLTVPVTVNCPVVNTFDQAPSMWVQVNQASGRSVAIGSGTVTITCDGQPHLYAVPVVAFNATFRNGPAVASASSFACGEFPDGTFGCTSGRVDAQQITVGKKG
jgi:hypothetical protein